MNNDILNPGTIRVWGSGTGNDHPCPEVLEVKEWYNPTITVNTQYFIDLKKFWGKPKPPIKRFRAIIRKQKQLHDNTRY